MHVLLPSDVFPPGSVGGAAWSSHTLALALLGQGQGVTAIVPQRGLSGEEHGATLGVPTVRVGYAAPNIPFVANYYRHERLWQPLAQVIERVGRRVNHSPVLIHAQHVQATPAAIIAGRALQVPVLATVRDHWPWDYFATGLHADRLPFPRSTWAGLLTDLPMRQGPLRGTLALPAVPYMLAHVRRRASFLAQADAVIAVSSYMAARLTGIVSPERIHVIPNMVDIAAAEQVAATPPTTVLDGPFLLFVGKLEVNKGAGLLADIFRAAPELPMIPLIIAGSGSLKPQLQHDLAALGVVARFLNWADHDEVLRLMARCTLLLFPSAWGEPLSRVPLEASALGAPILAMPTGGTPDIVSDGINGALAATPATFATRMIELLAHPDQRRRLAEQARRDAAARFAVEAVIPRYLALYRSLL
jgi:glycosyltransferase involved in cell wall biosynthesis